MSLPAARKSLAAVMPVRGRRSSHPGLLLQRYLTNSAAGKDGDPEEKRQIVSAAINAASNAESRQLYAAAYSRRMEQIERNKELTKADILQTAGRLIVGLGSENVLETGITLHHTYGMPILPGSALKGLGAHYCDQVWGASEPKFKKPTPEQDKAYRNWLEGRGPQPADNFHRLLFGTTDDSGCIIFHDGWFVPKSDPSPLKLDVMTPHHLDWLDGSAPPTDFDSPNPVPFLSVAGQFHIAVSWHSPVSDQAAAWTEFALSLLRDALFHWGIGGKTTSGYGLFDKTKWEADAEQRKLEIARQQEAASRQAALAAMSPLERDITQFLETEPNKTWTEYMRLLKELEKSNCRWTSEEDRRAVAERIKKGMQEAKTWGKKGKDAERTAFIKKILGES